MTTFRKLAVACAVSALTLNVAFAQTAPATAPAKPADAKAAPAKPFEPVSGQSGKDVVWVPTQQALVDQMMKMGKVTKDDYVIDLGSGDGRTVITAAKLGARAHGIEYNPDMVALSKAAAEKEGVSDRATFVQADIFESDFSKATVVTLFLLNSLNLKLRPTILDMKPGTRVVANTFDMGDWDADETATVGGEACSSFCRAYMWVVPAKVAGDWRLDKGELKLTQTYQKLSGTLDVGGKAEPISDAKMNGTEITFTAGGKTYKGQVTDGKMTGTVDGAQWSASRNAS
ncbi:SAM-dependent methyltransferase [Xanthobacteraceae bacterium A53D]